MMGWWVQRLICGVEIGRETGDGFSEEGNADGQNWREQREKGME